MTDELRGKLREWYNRARGYPTWEQAYNDIKPPISLPRFRSYMGEMGGKARNVTYRETDEGAEIESTSKRIVTLDDLLTACQVDLEQWEVEKFVITKHEMGRKETYKDLEFDEGKITGTLMDSGRLNVEPLINIKVWLKRRQEAPLAIAVESIIARLKEHAPQYKPPKALRPSGEYLLIPAIFDAHMNKRSIDGLYTVQQAKQDFIDASEALAARTMALGYRIDRIMIPAGNDALHADNLHGTTTKGTPLELAGAQGYAIAALCEAYTHLIERMATIAPVDVIMVPGNHDRYSTHWLGQVLAAQFSRHPHVSVDATCPERSYYQYGRNLIGLTHGDGAKPDKLYSLMTSEAKALFYVTDYQEVLVGNFHVNKRMRHYVTEEYGMNVSVFPALCPADQWHSFMGFVGNKRAATAKMYHREHGPAAEIPVFVDELAQTAAPAIHLAAA
jgi:hypothetical protein